MSSHIDFRTMPANVPVLCIPRVYPNISESRIRRIFDDLNMGTLERIDIVSKNSAKPGTEKGEKFNRVFIHFRRWNDTENANIARERLLNGKEIKIIYDDPWFWKISAYRESERKPIAAPKQKATIQFDSDEDRASNTKHVNSYREPRRQDERRRPENRRRDDSRRPENKRHDERRRPENRRRDDSRERQQDKICEVPKTQESHSEQANKTEKDSQADEGARVDYGNILPPFKKKAEKAVRRIEIEDDIEEGEIRED